MNRHSVAIDKTGSAAAIFDALFSPLIAAFRFCRRVLSRRSSGKQLGSMSEGWTTQQRSSRHKD